MAKSCPPVGLRVCLNANPAAMMHYRDGGPRPGECGTVQTVPLPGGRKTCFPGPGGGLVYVQWDHAKFQGVFRNHLVRETTGKPLGRATRRRSRRR